MKPPLLIVIDIQKEYTTAGRPFYLEGIGPSLEKANQVLKHARQKKWPVLHVQHIQATGIFSIAEGYEGFVPGFEPLPGEELAVKSNYSSYSSPEFVKSVATYHDRPFVVIGYGSTMCCLSTIVEGYHRGHKYVLASDASWSKRSGNLSEGDRHLHAIETLRIFCDVLTAKEILEAY